MIQISYIQRLIVRLPVGLKNVLFLFINKMDNER